MNPNNVSFIDKSGAQMNVAVDVRDYMEAADQGLSLSQHYERKYPTKANGPTAMEQFIASTGIRLRPDASRGIKASSLKEIYTGTIDKSAGTIVRDDGTNRHTPAGRILFPEIMMNLINSDLIDSKDDYLNPWESAIAVKSSVSGPRVDQPLIDTRAPEGSAAQPISQLAEPAVMVTITLSGRSYTIPTKSIGLQVSDEALGATTIDIVGITLAAQSLGERIRRIEEDMGNIIHGDTDFGINPVTFVNASTFGALGGNPIPHRNWVKWLRTGYEYMTKTHILADIDAALDIEARSGKPTIFTDQSAQQVRFPTDYTIENMGLPTPKILLLPTSIIGANSVVAFDSRSALHQITNVSASYSAIENWVMRRASGIRLDFGTALFKLYDRAFQGLTLNA